MHAVLPHTALRHPSPSAFGDPPRDCSLADRYSVRCSFRTLSRWVLVAKGNHPSFPADGHIDEVAVLPSPVVLLSIGLNRYYDRLRRPVDLSPTSHHQAVIERCLVAAIHKTRRADEGLTSSRHSLLNVPRPLRREVPRGGIQVLDPFHGLHPEGPGSAPPLPCAMAGTLTTRQTSLDAADRSVAPPKGLSTLGFDRNRFQSQPPVCYRASWQLPGRDLHPLAMTSLSTVISPLSSVFLVALLILV